MARHHILLAPQTPHTLLVALVFDWSVNRLRSVERSSPLVARLLTGHLVSLVILLSIRSTDSLVLAALGLQRIGLYDGQ